MAVDEIALMVMKSEEGHLSLVVVSVSEDLAVEAGRDVFSMPIELQLNDQLSIFFKKKLNMNSFNSESD